MIPLNIVYPFSYLMDIVKDCVQFVLLLGAVGGLSLVLKNWSSFSSTVWKIYLMTLWNKFLMFNVKLLASKNSLWIFFVFFSLLIWYHNSYPLDAQAGIELRTPCYSCTKISIPLSGQEFHYVIYHFIDKRLQQHKFNAMTFQVHPG